MLDLLIKAIEHGIELLREGERQKKLFLDEVVKPTQAAFEILYRDHLKTFETARTMILDKDSRAPEILDFVHARMQFERGTTELLVRLTKLDNSTDWRRLPKRGELEDRFNTYVARIATCLISPSVEVGPPRVTYYLALSNVLSSITNKKS